MAFRSFAALVIGLVSVLVSPWLSLLFLALALLSLADKSIKKMTISLGMFFAGAALAAVFPHGDPEATAITGLVVRSAPSYFLLATVRGIYYVPSKGEIPLFSAMRLYGHAAPLYFAGHEESFDFAGYLRRRGVFLSFTPNSADVLISSRLDLQAYQKWVLQEFTDDSHHLVQSFLFCTGAGSIESYSGYRALGLCYLLSGTGLHVSFVLHSVRTWLERKGHSRFAEWAFLPLCVFLLVVSGFRFAIWRITLLNLLSSPFGKKVGITNRVEVLSVTALVLLAFFPGMVADPSFYLPFGLGFAMQATAFIAKGQGKNRRRILSSIVSLLVLTPVMLDESATLSCAGFIGNFLMFLPSSMLFVLLVPAFLFPSWGSVVRLAVDGYMRVIALLGGIGGLAYGGIHWYFWIIWFGTLTVVVLLLALGFRRQGLLAATVLPICLLLTPVEGLLPKDEAIFLNVGQGDCTIVRKGNKNVLIDTGGSIFEDLAQTCLLTYLRRIRIKKLDAVILTHTDFDHSGALESLQEGIAVDKVFMGNETFGPFIAGGISFCDLNPRYGDSGENVNSGVYRFTVRGKTVLVMGDAPALVEREMMAAGYDVKADLLRIGHHGSDSSTSSEFLAAVSPSLAVISVGRNQYGHPTAAVLSRLDQAGVPYWRTDCDGTLVYRGAL